MIPGLGDGLRLASAPIGCRLLRRLTGRWRDRHLRMQRRRQSGQPERRQGDNDWFHRDFPVAGS
jgi:hypothetical protein